MKHGRRKNGKGEGRQRENNIVLNGHRISVCLLLKWDPKVPQDTRTGPMGAYNTSAEVFAFNLRKAFWSLSLHVHSLFAAVCSVPRVIDKDRAVQTHGWLLWNSAQTVRIRTGGGEWGASEKQAEDCMPTCS